MVAGFSRPTSTIRSLSWPSDQRSRAREVRPEIALEFFLGKGAGVTERQVL